MRFSIDLNINHVAWNANHPEQLEVSRIGDQGVERCLFSHYWKTETAEMQNVLLHWSIPLIVFSIFRKRLHDQLSIRK